MADNVDITPGSGRTVLSDERTIGGILGIIQRVSEIGGSSLTPGSDTSVTTTAENVAARETRKRIVLYADEANTANILFGNSGSQVVPIPPGMSATVFSTAAVYYKSASGTQTLHYWEEHD